MERREYQEPSPVNPVPAPVLALAAVLIGIEIVFWAAERGILGGAAGIGWRAVAQQDYGFAPRLWAFMAETGTWRWDALSRLLTYSFVGLGFINTVFSCVFVLAFGKFVGDAMGAGRAIAIFFIAGAGGAAMYGLWAPSAAILSGAFPGAYGLLGAYTFVLLVVLDATDGNRLQAFQLVGILAALQLVFGVFLGGAPYWIADLGGAAVGFVAAAALGPGGLLRWTRRR